MIRIILFYNWSLVPLQWCASFCCTVKWISFVCTYIPSVTTEHWVEFPVPYSRFSLVIYAIRSSLWMSIPISQFIPPSPFPPWYLYIFSLYLCLYFCFANRFICKPFFQMQHVCVNIWYLFLFFWLIRKIIPSVISWWFGGDRRDAWGLIQD